MRNGGRNRVHGTPQAPTSDARRASPAAPLHSSILGLHRGAGNRAVARLLSPTLQRSVGWSDASTQGRAWNVDERAVGKVRRIPLEGLSEGLGGKRADARIPELSSESAKGKAIVLVPAGLDATKQIEVLVFLHGFTEGTWRPYAGWRTLDNQPPKPSAHMQDLRKGIDSTDVAPVRDVALDQAEQQLEESGQKQLVVVLPQGGLTSQFGKDGGQNFDSDAYVKQIVSRLQAEKRWKDAKGKVVTAAPGVARVVMAGHSGAGAALSEMADHLKITGDLVIYDAINGSQFSSFKKWALKRLDEDYAVLTDKSKSDAEKLKYLQTAQKLRGYTTDYYISPYIDLDNAINWWFDRHKAKLGAFAPCLRANYTLDYLDVDHEELMRGSTAATQRASGTGTILDAIKGLHQPLMTSTASCPPMPKPLSLRWKERKAEEAREKAERLKEERQRRRDAAKKRVPARQ